MKYLKKHLREHIQVGNLIDLKSIDKILNLLTNLKKNKGSIVLFSTFLGIFMIVSGIKAEKKKSEKSVEESEIYDES